MEGPSEYVWLPQALLTLVAQLVNEVEQADVQRVVMLDSCQTEDEAVSWVSNVISRAGVQSTDNNHRAPWQRTQQWLDHSSEKCSWSSQRLKPNQAVCWSSHNAVMHELVSLYFAFTHVGSMLSNK